MLRDEVPKRSRTGQFAKTTKTYKKILMATLSTNVHIAGI